MKQHQSPFERGRNIVRTLIVLAIAFGVLGLMFSGENITQQMTFLLAALACVAGVVVASLTLCRCPYCGKRIVSGVLVVKVCPQCRRSLSTGRKVKR